MLSEKMIYVHSNGVVEGFLGKGKNMVLAHRDALNKVKNTLTAANEQFDKMKLRTDLSTLTPAEINKVSADYKKYL